MNSTAYSLLAAGLQAGRTTTLDCVAAAALAIYDTLINIDDEVELIWSSPSRSWTKWSYLIVRHTPWLWECSLIVLMGRVGRWSYSQCRFWLIWQFVASEVFMFMVEVILVARVYAIYNRSRPLLGVLAAMLFVEIGAMCTVLILTVPKIVTDPGTCLVTATPKVFPYMWLIPLIFETTLFVLTIAKFVKSVTYQRYVGGRESIMFILMRDGTWAYALIFVILLLNTIFYTRVHDLLEGICFVWVISVLSFAGSHILLNMRRVAARPSCPSTWVATDTIEFNPGPITTESPPVDTGS